MKTHLLSTIVVLFFIPLSIMAEWIPLGKNQTANVPPKVELLQSDAHSAVIKIELSGFLLDDVKNTDKKYKRVSFSGEESFTLEEGKPELPYIARVLAIPDQAAVSVEIIETGSVFTFSEILIPPARPTWWEGEPEPSYLERSDAYNSTVLYPSMMAEMDKPSVFRDFRIARLAIYPVRYIPESAELQVYSSVTVKVIFGKGEVINPKTSPKKPISPDFAKLYRSFIFNYDEVLQQHYQGREEGHEVMLCIMPDEFTESFQIYADWKRQSGTDIHITKFSDIGANGSNPDIVKNHITEAYNTWENPPTYILIIGDNGVFPKKMVTYPGYTFAWEEYFVTIEGNDYFPEMMIGRFTNQENYRMTVMINKFMLYEKEPWTEDTLWFKKATCCSNNEYESQVETKRFTTAQMLDYGNFFSVDTMMSDGSWWGGNCTYELSDIKEAINEGRGWLNYRGEGWYYGWYANCYDFHTDDVSTLNNGQKFTFVTSIGCGVGMFDASGGNCFGEEWVEMGTLTNPRGACAFIGPTSNTHTTYNNRIDKGIYVGMFQEGMDTPGQALARGKLYMYNVFGNEYYVEYHYKVFCTLGDPSIHIWKEIPKNVNVDYPASVPVGDDQIEFEVTFSETGAPVANAEIVVTGEDIFATDTTNANGILNLQLTVLEEQDLVITVRGGNVIPFQGTMQVIQPDELIEPVGAPEIVDLNGNNDGKVNPNETCSITYTLKNWGSTGAINVEATLSSSDPYVEILNPASVSFGNIEPGAQSTGNPFEFFVSPDCPVGHDFSLQLHVVTTNYSWDYYTTVIVKGCILVCNDFVVFDGGTANHNFRMDAGETVVLVLSVSNIGEDIAPEVMGILSSSDPNFSVIDNTGSFGTMAINTTSTNPSDHFGITVSEDCPPGLYDFDLNLLTQNGNYPYEMITLVRIHVGIPVEKDYTGPDEYGYYAYSSDDTFYEQTPEYNWMELLGTGTQIGLPGISNYTQTIDLPFSFKYYGNNFTQLRISTDGWIAFGNGTQTAPINTGLPANDNVNNMVAVCWDDLLDEEFFMGKIFYHYDQPNNRFIVEWDSISHNGFIAEPVRETFQAVLLDPVFYPTQTGDGEIIMQYRIMQQPETITVGIENATQDVGLEYLFDANYNQTATTLKNSYAIKFTTEPPFETMVVPVHDPNVAENNLSCYLHNQPNPFNGKTTIGFSLAESGFITVSVMDVRGVHVKTLFEGNKNAGDHLIEWNGYDDSGLKMPPGVYFCHLKTDKITKAIKLLMSR